MLFFATSCVQPYDTLMPTLFEEGTSTYEQTEMNEGDFIYAYFYPMRNLDPEKYEPKKGVSYDDYIEYISHAYLIFKGDTESFRTPEGNYLDVSEFKLFIDGILQDTSNFAVYHGGAVLVDNNNVYYPSAITKFVKGGEFFTKYELYLGQAFKKKPAKYWFEVTINGISIRSNTLVWHEDGSGEWLNDDMPTPSLQISLTVEPQSSSMIDDNQNQSYRALANMYSQTDFIVLGYFGDYESSWNAIRNPENLLMEAEDIYQEAYIYTFHVEKVLKGELNKTDIRFCLPFTMEPEKNQTVMLFMHYLELLELYKAACTTFMVTINDSNEVQVKPYLIPEGGTDFSGIKLEEILSIFEIFSK